jgi:hypothetical protein
MIMSLLNKKDYTSRDYYMLYMLEVSLLRDFYVKNLTG